MSRRRLQPLRAERGSVALEWAVWIPGVLLVIAVIALAGRVTTTAGAVEQAANDAARAASIARTPSEAVTEAHVTGQMSLTDQGIDCLALGMDVDTSGFHRPAGQHATVAVTITCPIRVMDLPIPGITERVATSTGTSPIDTYRQR
ncbi:TadE/TadG family type IV pilus assembly protein [Phytoactinopolyspora limicola]|uniref:TadE/TadG family type IV pilus assembly protein n=1 Tax=Phytoactinopolyspora limicola TaxID=2715536 RepID=UPI001408FD5F|nr:TadE/TadG family type IV pilus assembly protein [Phytoactinopolyspora limicola]